MSDDARFEDGAEKPLALRAEGPDDLAVVAALLQDAVGQVAEVSWQPKRHRFALLLSRFRWEDSPRAKRARRSFERVRSLLVFDGVLAARSDDLAASGKDTVFALLEITWQPDADGAGQLQLILSGDGIIVLECECLDVTLTDVARPHKAKSLPDHDG